MPAISIKYCSQCGETVEITIPDGDNLPRHVCINCGFIHYVNPKIVAGCIPEWKDKILLCKRAIEPCHGLWTLPAGFMENNETTAQAANRETTEEANANIEDLSLYAMFDIPHISQVYIMYRARLRDLDFHPGTESLEVKLFEQHEIPWNEIAFAVMTKTLECYFADKKRGEFPIHVAALQPTA